MDAKALFYRPSRMCCFQWFNKVTCCGIWLRRFVRRITSRLARSVASRRPCRVCMTIANRTDGADSTSVPLQSKREAIRNFSRVAVRPSEMEARSSRVCALRSRTPVDTGKPL